MRKNCLLISIIICSLTVIHCFATVKQQQDDAVKVKRLIALCKLWGKIKFFHPALAYRTDIDWDKALVETIPKVNAAKNPDELRNAFQSMLDVLGDPLTRIVGKTSTETSSGSAKKFGYKLTEDKVLIVTVGSYFDLYSSESQQLLAQIQKEIPNARAVIFDLRSEQDTGAFGEGALTSSFSQIERLLFSKPLTTSGERSRIYYGYPNISPFSSGQYKSGFFTIDGKKITPIRNAKDTASIFIVNKNSGLFPSTLPLQAAGKSLIVFDGDAGEGAIGKTEMLELSDGLTAQVRLSELIYEDGTSGEMQPDVIVKVGQGEKDNAVETALKLAGDFKPSTVIRKKLPEIGSPTPEKSYPQMEYPALEYRLLAAFRLWNTINYFFPYKHLMERDWEDVLREFIPKFERSKNALEYSLTVAEMTTHLHDSHVYIRGTAIDKYLGLGYPPICVRMIENALVVVSFRDESVAKVAGIEIGDIIVKVDGEDAKTRLARYAKYMSASTPQSNINKAAISFMNGDVDSIATITVRDRANREKEVKLKRKYEDFNTLYHRERTGDVVKLLPGNIGYVDLDRFTRDEIDEMLEKFKNTRGIIFDMRGYPFDMYWFLSPRLTEKQNVAAAFLETPLVGQNTSSNSSEAFYQMIPPTPRGKWVYKGKTVMLIDERAASQAEHTGLFFRAANGTKFIGSRTTGVDGELTTFSVPGAITIGFTGQSVKFPDGKQLQRIGLIPDVEVKETIRGIRGGSDEVLEAAIKYFGVDRKNK